MFSGKTAFCRNTMMTDDDAIGYTTAQTRYNVCFKTAIKIIDRAINAIKNN